MSNNSDAYIFCSVTHLHHMDDAVLFKTESGVKVWIPRSCIHAASDAEVSLAKPGDELRLQIREWMADKKGL